MATLDKDIRILMLKGKDGPSAYQEAVEKQLFSGTLEEWIETFATPDNYVTRLEFQKVTQEEYDALEEAEELTPNCYYIITDDDTWELIQGIISDLEQVQTDVETIQGEIETIQSDIGETATKITALETAKDDIYDRLDDIEDQDIYNLQQDVSDLEATTTSLNNRINDLSSIVNLLGGNSVVLNYDTQMTEDKEVLTSYDLTLSEGVELYVQFRLYGSVSQWTYMRLEVNAGGSLPITKNGSIITSNDTPVWSANDIVKLKYTYNSSLSGYSWEFVDNVSQHKNNYIMFEAKDLNNTTLTLLWHVGG